MADLNCSEVEVLQAPLYDLLDTFGRELDLLHFTFILFCVQRTPWGRLSPLHWRFHFFVASVHVWDLLIRAKYLFVAAILAGARR